MKLFKYIFHKHKWKYFGRFTDQFILRCTICHREKIIKTEPLKEGEYTPEQIDKFWNAIKNGKQEIIHTADD